MWCSQAVGRYPLAAQGGSRLTTEDFLRELFERVDEAMLAVPTQAQASLWPSAVVTRGVRFALTGVGTRAFARWVSRDWRGWVPALPERTRLVRLVATPPVLGRRRVWLRPRSWGEAIARGLSCSTPCGRGAGLSQAGAKGKPTSAGLSGRQALGAAHSPGLGRGLGLCGSPGPGERLASGECSFGGGEDRLE